jgi:hypothetical protein
MLEHTEGGIAVRLWQPVENLICSATGMCLGMVLERNDSSV